MQCHFQAGHMDGRGLRVGRGPHTRRASQPNSPYVYGALAGLTHRSTITHGLRSSVVILAKKFLSLGQKIRILVTFPPDRMAAYAIRIEGNQKLLAEADENLNRVTERLGNLNTVKQDVVLAMKKVRTEQSGIRKIRKALKRKIHRDEKRVNRYADAAAKELIEEVPRKSPSRNYSIYY